MNFKATLAILMLMISTIAAASNEFQQGYYIVSIHKTGDSNYFKNMVVMEPRNQLDEENASGSTRTMFYIKACSTISQEIDKFKVGAEFSLVRKYDGVLLNIDYSQLQDVQMNEQVGCFTETPIVSKYKASHLLQIAPGQKQKVATDAVTGTEWYVERINRNGALVSTR